MAIEAIEAALWREEVFRPGATQASVQVEPATWHDEPMTLRRRARAFLEISMSAHTAAQEIVRGD